jgi:predicted AAA+ superfamily ATPase
MKGYFPRRLESVLRRAAKQFPAVMVTGPRQSGKTTLLRQVFGTKYRYVSLDDPDHRRQALADPRGFLEDNPPPLILDEIQQAPELLPFLKMAIDEDRDARGRFLLTGSQSFPLMRDVSESLAGRVAVLRLLPLAVAENPGARVPPVRDRETYARWALTGSYPELHRHPDLDRATWYASYQQTYLERDVRTLANVGNLRDFDRLLALLASRSGTLLNHSDLARELGVAANTVRAWVSVLEASQQVFLCPAWFESLGKRVIKSPRAHILDSGLLCRLTGVVSEEQVLHGPLAGAIFESLVGAELLRLMTDAGDQPHLYHRRTVGGEEVDFVFEAGGRVHGVECKLTSTPLPRHVQALESFLAALPAHRRGAALLVCTRPRAGHLGSAHVIPIGRFRYFRGLQDLIEG